MSSVLAETNLTLPTQDNLPANDGEPMETERHRKQMELLMTTLEPWLDMPLGERKSWVSWEEGKTPDIVNQY